MQTAEAQAEGQAGAQGIDLDALMSKRQGNLNRHERRTIRGALHRAKRKAARKEERKNRWNSGG